MMTIDDIKGLIAKDETRIVYLTIWFRQSLTEVTNKTTPQVMTVSPQDIMNFTPSQVSFHLKIRCLNSVNRLRV